LKELLDHGKPESEEAELELMGQHQVDYEKIYAHLKKLTNTFSEEKITPHHTTALVLLDLCRDERKWEFLTEEERKNLTKNKLIQDLKEPKQYLKAVLTKKLISYICKGKITFAHSFKYQDIGKVIESIELSDGDWRLTREDIEKLIAGTYPINFEAEIVQTPSIDDWEHEQDYHLYNKIPFQQVQNQVSGLVADHNPEWFQSHKAIFEKMTDWMFEMEYDELTFLTRLYEAIGFLGRNLRFSDSPSFYRLQYFIQRYLSDATLDLKFRHLWKVYEDLTWHKTPIIIIIDSMGIDSRRKSLFAKIHGRYRTIGFADVRAISLYLIPVFSSNCRSSDSEAMNSKQKGYDFDDFIQLVETSNRQKRVVRIVERGVTRVSEPNVSLVLKSAELILLMSAIVNILNGK